MASDSSAVRVGGLGQGQRSPDDDADVAVARKADELGARSLALVAFGTGVGGFPVEEAARIEVTEVRRHLEADSGLKRVVFAVRGEAARKAFERALEG